MIRQTIIRFGVLAAIVVLLLLVGEYALFLKPRASSWIVAGAALLLLTAGVWMGQMLRRKSDPPSAPPAEESLDRLGVSPREYEVLRLVADGLSNQEIAERLFISESTVKTHVSNLLLKLDAKRRTHAVRRARQEGLLR